MRSAGKGLMFRRTLFAVAACCLLVASKPVPAQVDRGGIVGVITDPAGARVAAAQVTITNRDTNKEVKIATDDEGNYAAQMLKIGNYSVSAEKPGFQKTLEPSVEVGVNQVARVDLMLKVG